VFEVVLQPFPPAVPGTDLTGVVISTHSGGGLPIPKNGAVLLARGSQVAKLQAEATPGTPLLTRLILQPDWLSNGVTDALGGGPVIVRSGKPVWTAGEDFLPSQLGPRNPRTAVGQRADGKIILLAVDGRRRGFSVGMTNWELAQAMVRLGAVTASGARRGRLDDDGLRRQAAEPAPRPGRRSAGRRVGWPCPLHRRLRARRPCPGSSRRRDGDRRSARQLAYKV
jgi:hypothetical protein